ncbi:MAG: NUDIX hydrolase [Cyanophyceae cyanobacterium]
MPNIRVLALGLITQGDRTFLSQGVDPATQQPFYRAMGGGVDFGETSLEALKREFREEIDAELTNIRYLGCLENIFVFKNKPGHEIIQLYQCDFADPQFYQLGAIDFNEGKRKKTAVWIDREACLSGQLRVVPQQFLDYL